MLSHLPQLGAIAAGAVSLCQGQLGNPIGDLGGNTQGSLPCDDRFFLCPHLSRRK